MNERNHDEGRATRRVPARNWADWIRLCLGIVPWIAGALWGTPLSAHAAEPLPIRWKTVGDWPGILRGVPVDMDIQGDRLAVALGTGGWRLLDIQDPSRPTLVASELARTIDTFLSGVNSLDLSAQRLYAASDVEGFLVYDVSNSATPRRRNRFLDANVSPVKIRGRDDLAVLLLDTSSEDDPGTGLIVFDVSREGTPEQLGSVTVDMEFPVDVAFTGSLALVLAWDVLYIVDLTDPRHPKVNAALQVETYFNGMQVVGNLVYAATGDGLMVIDVGTAANPRIIGTWEAPLGTSDTVSVAVEGTRAFLARDNGVVHVLDVARPAAPRAIGRLDGLGAVIKVGTRGDVVWVLNDLELVGMSVADPNRPTTLSRVALGGGSEEVVLAGSRALVADGSGGVVALDASDPSHLQFLGRWKGEGDAVAIAAEGPWAYVANSSGHLEVLDLSDPSFRIRSRLPISGGPVSIAAEGSVVLVGTDYDGLQIIEAKAGEVPRHLATYQKGSAVGRVQIHGDFAAVLVDNEAIHIIDLREPSAPAKLSAIGVALDNDEILDFDWVGAYLYAIDVFDLRVFDLSRIPEPKLVGAMELRGIFYETIRVRGRLALVSGAEEGLRVYDVGNPFRPRFLSLINTSGEVRSIDGAGDRLWIADGSGGVLVMDPDFDPGHPPEIVQSPEDTVGAPGGTVTLDLVAGGGGGELSYQWRKNGVNLSGQTNETLVLTNLGIADGGSYSVQVTNINGLVLSSPGLVTLEGIPERLRDDFSGSLAFAGSTGVVSGDSSIATLEKGEPRHANKSGSRSLWMSWRPQQSGIATWNTQGSSYDTLLGIYTGGSLSNLTEVASDDDRGGFLTSQVTFNAVSNTVYHIAVANYGPSSGATGIKVANGLAYVIDVDFGLQIFDLKAPETPQLLGAYQDDEWPFDVAVDGHYAYLLDEAGLNVLDVSRPQDPTRVAFFPISGISWGLAVANGFAFVAADTEGWIVLDVRNPADPKVHAIYRPSAEWDGQAMLAALDGRYAYVYDWWRLIALDLSNPGSVVPVWQEDFTDEAVAMVVSGGHLFVAVFSIGGESSLRIYNIEDRKNTYLEGEAELDVPATGLAVDGSMAYLTDSDGIIHVIDASDPASPKVTDGYYQTSGGANGVAVVGTHVLVAGGPTGLIVLEVEDAGKLRPVGGFSSTPGNAVVQWKLEPTLDRLPVIVTQPAARTLAKLGDTATLSVSASSPGVSYQWFWNGTAKPGATGSTLAFAPVLPRDAGSYRVRLTNAEGRQIDSQDAQLEIVAGDDQLGLQVSTYKVLDLLETGAEGGAAPVPALQGMRGLAAVSAVNQGRANQWTYTTDVPIPPVVLDSCSVLGTQGRWFSFRPQATKNWKLSTTGSEVRTVLGVFTNRFALRVVECTVANEAGSGAELILPLVRGNEYLILVASADGRPGGLQINWTGNDETLEHWQAQVLQGHFFFWGPVPSGRYRIESRRFDAPWDRWDVRTNLETSGRLEYLDPNLSDEPARFYRPVPIQ